MADHDRSVHHDVGLVELGSGRLQLLGVGAKASLVDRAARAGLAVPLGVVLLDGAPAPAAADLPAELRAPDHGLAVRSAFSLEDGRTESHAGRFRSLLRVGPDGITEAVADVRASADADSPGSMRRDVLIMDMVDARHAGVAFSEPGWYDDLVNVTTGTAEHLVAGDEPGNASSCRGSSTPTAHRGSTGCNGCCATSVGSSGICRGTSSGPTTARRAGSCSSDRRRARPDATRP